MRLRRSKTLFLENPTNLLLSYRFRFIGCKALCIRVRDSRNTDSQPTNEDVRILTSLNFISLSFSLSPPSYFMICFFFLSFFLFFVIRCSSRFPIFSHTYHSRDFPLKKCGTRERGREREYNLIRSKSGMIEFFEKI